MRFHRNKINEIRCGYCGASKNNVNNEISCDLFEAASKHVEKFEISDLLDLTNGTECIVWNRNKRKEKTTVILLHVGYL